MKLDLNLITRAVAKAKRQRSSRGPMDLDALVQAVRTQRQRPGRGPMDLDAGQAVRAQRTPPRTKPSKVRAEPDEPEEIEEEDTEEDFEAQKRRKHPRKVTWTNPTDWMWTWLHDKDHPRAFVREAHRSTNVSSGAYVIAAVVKEKGTFQWVILDYVEEGDYGRKRIVTAKGTAPSWDEAMIQADRALSGRFPPGKRPADAQAAHVQGQKQATGEGVSQDDMARKIDEFRADLEAGGASCGFGSYYKGRRTSDAIAPFGYDFHFRWSDDYERVVLNPSDPRHGRWSHGKGQFVPGPKVKAALDRYAASLTRMRLAVAREMKLHRFGRPPPVPKGYFAGFTADQVAALDGARVISDDQYRVEDKAKRVFEKDGRFWVNTGNVGGLEKVSYFVEEVVPKARWKHPTVTREVAMRARDQRLDSWRGGYDAGRIVLVRGEPYVRTGLSTTTPEYPVPKGSRTKLDLDGLLRASGRLPVTLPDWWVTYHPFDERGIDRAISKHVRRLEDAGFRLIASCQGGPGRERRGGKAKVVQIIPAMIPYVLMNTEPGLPRYLTRSDREVRTNPGTVSVYATGEDAARSTSAAVRWWDRLTEDLLAWRVSHPRNP